MIQLAAGLWIGNSGDSQNFRAVWPTAVLNVAQDLAGAIGWPDVEYAQVGLIDGPGNEVGDYCSAILALRMLTRRHDVVLVYDHAGERALVVGMMYLNVVEGQFRSHTAAWGYWPTWQERLALVRRILQLPEPHAAHAEAFNLIPWGVLATFV
jgi:hypothetical protein